MYSKPQIPQTKDADSEGSHSNPLIKHEPEIGRHDDQPEKNAGTFSRRLMMQPSSTEKGRLQMKTTSDNINRLQMQSIGNGGLVIQPSLVIGKPGDKYEQEADRIAEKVVNGKDAVISREPESKGVQLQEEEEELLQPKSIAEQITPLVQRQEEEEEEELLQPKLLSAEHHTLQRQAKPEEKEEEEYLQPKAETGVRTTVSTLSNRIKNSSGKGKPLPGKTRAEMENVYGIDFRRVNIHTNSEAVQMNKELTAHAFTYGKGIYFNSGRYRPESMEGKRLLAHELTHVVQQGEIKHNHIQRSFWRRAGIGAATGGLVLGGLGALIGGLAGGGTGALLGGLIGAGLGAIAGGLIGGLTGRNRGSNINSESGNTEILTTLREISARNVNRQTARRVMEVLDQLSENRLRVIIMDLIRSGDYNDFRQRIVEPAENYFSDLTNRIETLFNEYSNPTQNTQDATSAQRDQVSDILNQGMNVTSTGQVQNFVDIVNGRTYYQDVTDQLENEITALTPTMQARDIMPRFGWSRYEQIADEAKIRTDALYGHYNTGTAISATGAGANLFDISVQTYSNADLIYFANYLLTGHRARAPVYPGETIHSKHNADLSRDTEGNILSTAIADWMAQPGNRDRILLIRRNWSGAQAGGNIYIQRYRYQTDDQNRWQFWRTFKTMIHEYLHKITHNNYSSRARQLGRRHEQIFTEGGTSYFDRNVWNTLWPDEIRTNPQLRENVEGGQYDYDESVIPGWSGYEQTSQFEQIVGVVGEENARAAYFRGEVEKIGMPVP